MNWNLIKEKYPESFHLAKWFWLGQTHLEPFEEFNIVPRMRANPRFLYDFFDEQGIFITVSYDRAYQFFWWQITNEDAKCENMYWTHPPSEAIYKTRTEAEEQAFLRAFKILEEKL